MTPEDVEKLVNNRIATALADFGQKIVEEARKNFNEQERETNMEVKISKGTTAVTLAAVCTALQGVIKGLL